MSDAISILSPRGRKKKDDTIIGAQQLKEHLQKIGATRSNSTAPQQVQMQQPTVANATNNVASSPESTNQQQSQVQQNTQADRLISQPGDSLEPKAQMPTPLVNQPVSAGISALSLSSIRKRRELQDSLEPRVLNTQDLPRENFTLETLMQEWNAYSDRLQNAGLMLMSSLMGMTRPELNGAIINLELPNQGSKLSFDENKYELVNYLRKKLQNYDIEIHINVNEQIKLAKRVLDSKDKYQRFLEINSSVDLLRQTFDLDLK
ncbi:hypothetical protein ACYSNX_12660 [Myroides sp. LJL115]